MNHLEWSGVKILIIDGDEGANEILTTQLSAEGFEASAVTSGTNAIHSMLQNTPDLVILESTFEEEDPFSSAWDAFGIINWINRNVPEAHVGVILHTSDRSAKFLERVESSGVLALLEKTGNVDELIVTVRIAAAQRNRSV